MDVFRVERMEDRTGPYQSYTVPSTYYSTYEKCMVDYMRYINDPVTNAINDGDSERHPGPHDDHLGDVSRLEYLSGWGDVIFGFATLEQAKAWFEGFGMMLFENYYALARYTIVPEYTKRGLKQIVFDRTRAERVEDLDPRILDGAIND